MCFLPITSSLFPWHLDYRGRIWRLGLRPGPWESSARDCGPVLLLCLLLGDLHPLVGHYTTALQEGDPLGSASFGMLMQLVPNQSCQVH